MKLAKTIYFVVCQNTHEKVKLIYGQNAKSVYVSKIFIHPYFLGNLVILLKQKRANLLLFDLVDLIWTINYF